MKAAFSLLLALLPLSCFAQWDSDAWSGTYHRFYLDASTNKVMIKPVLQSNTIAALQERAMALGGTYSTNSAWWRGSRAHLTTAKTWIKANCSSFVDTSNPLSTTEGLQTWSYTNLLTAAGAPTNYLDDTPWRLLQRPATTNGWMLLDEVINKLVWVYVDGAQAGAAYSNGATDVGHAQFSSTSCTTTYAAADWNTTDWPARTDTNGGSFGCSTVPDPDRLLDIGAGIIVSGGSTQRIYKTHELQYFYSTTNGTCSAGEFVPPEGDITNFVVTCDEELTDTDTGCIQGNPDYKIVITYTLQDTETNPCLFLDALNAYTNEAVGNGLSGPHPWADDNPQPCATNVYTREGHRTSQAISYVLPTTNYEAGITEYYLGTNTQCGYIDSDFTWTVEGFVTGTLTEDQWAAYAAQSIYWPTTDALLTNITDNLVSTNVPHSGAADATGDQWGVADAQLLIKYDATTDGFQFVE